MFKNRFEKKTYRQIILGAGILLILAGILLCFFIIKAQYDDCAIRYRNNLDGFASKYDSVWDCFLVRSEGVIILSILAGLVPIGFGCILIAKKY